MTKTIIVPVEPTEKMLRAADGATDLIMPSAVDPSTEGRLKEFKLAWRTMLDAAPKPTVTDDDREAVARVIYVARVKHIGLDLTWDGACMQDKRGALSCAAAAISTLTSRGWGKR